MVMIAPRASQTGSGLVDRINVLRRERDALILAHNYERDEVQDIADFTGDSLSLARYAAESTARTIVLCGVHFMAETAAILCPDRTVLLPDLNAGCSLADSITADQLRSWKQLHPGAVVISYVNTTAAVKAESDYCCTSSNAAAVVESIPIGKEILFCPDMFLGAHVARVTGRQMHIWMGECHVHAGISPASLSAISERYPKADVLVHPECGCATPVLWAMGQPVDKGKEHQSPPRHVVASTDAMVRYVRSADADQFIVATELGIIHQLRQAAPTKEFIPASRTAICPYMKMITLDKVCAALETMSPVITVDAVTAARARIPIERMLEIAPASLASPAATAAR